MSARRFALLAALAFTVMFVASNLIANSWFRAWRLDLTENGLYSLSPGTQEVLDNLSEPVELKLYFSRDAAAADPRIQTFGARVREMLQTFAARSHGRVRFVEVNVAPFSEEEDDAVEAGVQPRQLFQGGDPFYFGLVGANAIDDKVAIDSFSPDREPFLEYEITRLIYALENPDRTRVGLITSLPIDPGAAQNPFGGANQTVFAAELGRFFDVVTLAPDFTEIPADLDVLAIIHPQPLTPLQAFAVDQFILRQGRAFVAIDPASMTAQRAGGFDPFSPMPMAQTSSTLEPLLGAWGVALTRDVVLDREGALPINTRTDDGRAVTAPQPLFFSVAPDRLDREDMMTALFRRGINFGMAGGLSWSERAGVTATPLARTTGDTMRIPAVRALMNPPPFEVLRDWPPAGGRIETVALRLSGALASAFPDGPPEDAPPAADGSAPLTASATHAEIVIVADADFLADELYMMQDGGAVADNASFAINAIDILGGSDALVSLRSRAPAPREMVLVQEMENSAQARILERQEDLQAELQETEASLARLQAQGRGSGFFTGDLGAELTSEERAELERFRARMVEVRGELRRVGRDLRGDIDRLEALVIFINVWLAPILIAAVGLFLFWRRQRRARAGSAR